MTRLDDETLMSFADGTLPADEHDRVETHLAGCPEDRAVVDMFRRASDLAKQGVEGVDLRPRDDLIDFVRGTARRDHDDATMDDDVSTVVPFLKTPHRRVSVARYVLPLAAAAALVVGFTGGYLLGFNRVPTTSLAIGHVDQRSTLAAVLDRSPSGAPSTIDGTLQVVATFADAANRPCREFERLERVGSRVPVEAGIACRTPRGWSLEGAARIASGSTEPGFKPSGSQDRDALAGVVDRLGAKPSLSPLEEKNLLDRNWQ